MAVMNALGVAFKEWAVICRALALGRQTILLRKGGIAEDGGRFRVEHASFWLFPTYAHQQPASLVAGYQSLLDEALASRPPEGTVRLTHLADVAQVHHVDTLEKALALRDLHGWSEETVTARFHYREPGLYVLGVRVRGVAAAVELPETPYFAGCRSWVELGRKYSTEPSAPTLSEETFSAVMAELRSRLEC